MTAAHALVSRTVAAVLAIAIVVAGIVHTTPAWAATVTTGTPTISGNAGVGSTLSVDTGTWDPAETTFAYQWTRDDVNIDSATSSTYTTVLADVGAAIKVVVTGSADGFDPNSATSSNSITPVLNDFATTTSPTISGTEAFGATLTASVSGWSPSSGVSYTYQWKRTVDSVTTDIALATNPTYTLTVDDIGATISVAIEGTKSGYNAVSTTSTDTGTIAEATFGTTTNPTIAGTKRVGSTLTASVSGWSPSSGVSYTYQWKRTVDGVTSDISLATDSTYDLTADDLDATISVAIEGSKTGYTPVTTTSAATTAIVANSFASTGTASVDVTTTDIGDVLSATEGTWSPSTDVTFSYQWQRKVGSTTTDIDGETNSTYALTLDDMGNSVRVVVTAHLAGYLDTDSTSSFAAIPLLPFSTSGSPSLDGENVAGGTLAVDPTGVFTPSDGTTYTYRWFTGGVLISGETTDSYIVRSGDTGSAITVEVTAHADGYDPEPVLSNAITIVPATRFTLAPRPTISGLPQVGKTLTIVPGTWSPLPTAVNVQWFRNGVAIDSATDDTYTLVGADAGALITVAYTAHKWGYEVKSRTSVATSAVLAGVFTVKPTPTISGTERVGMTLTVDEGAWTPTPDGYLYQWFRDGVAIPSATASTYQLAAADRSTLISVRVTPAMSGYVTPSRTSLSTGTIARGVLVSSTPTISGTVAVGHSISVATGSWTSGTVFTYQWKRNGVAITGATSDSFAITGIDAGTQLSVTVSGSKTGYSGATATSANTITVPASEFTGGGTPTINGDAEVGSTLSVDFGTLSPTPSTVNYEWTSDGTLVGTGATYTPTASDIDASIVVSVSASALGYTTWNSGDSDPVVVDYGTIGSLTSPTVLGTARLGRILTGTVGTWTNTPDSYDYQWYADGVPIDGATSLTYSPVEGDIGATLAFEVTAHKAGYNDEIVVSAATPEVRYASFNLQPIPTISGTAKVNNTLTAVTGSWSPTPESFDYQWTRNGTPITGATSSTYTLAPSDASTLIRVVVTGVHAGYEGDPQPSLPTASVTPGSFSLKPAPTINDTTPVVGQTLTASVSDWTPTQDSFAYSWSRTVGGVTSVIVDASSATYTVVAADLGATLTVTATATLDGYATTAVASTATSAVANGTFDVSPAPTISGTATIGQTLTATAGDWSPSATLAYQWKRNGNVIAGATSSTYTVQLADATATITVSVTGSRTAYTSITRTSVATSTIEPLTFTDVVPPTIDGADVVGKPLRASTGTWSPTQDRFTYQWLCDGDPIVAATASTFTPTGTELGCEISVEMTGIKLGYRSITLTSDVTGAIDYGTFDATPNPTISGTLAVGNTLTANPGTWVPSAELSYQWTRDGDDIDGATDSTYTLTADDFDCVIGVYVVGTKLGYLDSNFLPSADTAAIALGTIRPAPTPTVSGTVKVGSTLTATVGTWGGLGDDVAVSYQWTRTKAGVTTEIDGATDDSYVLTADDLGATMRFVVTGTMAGYADANKSSSATATVAKGAFASPHVPTLTGTVAVGKTVTVDMGDWSPNEPTFSYQWFRGKKAIAGATSSTFVPRTIDIGTKIWVTVGATELGFIPITLDSSKSLVAMGAFDTSPVPTISSSGTFTVGETLTATAGSWTPGPSGTTLTYQWFRGGVAIAGQTAATYVLQGGDAGTSITVTVTATRDGFVTTTRTSLSTSLIAKADFTASPTPLIVLPNGSPAKVGEIVSVNIGDWAPLQFPLWTPVAGRIAYSYQWYLDGVAVDGATHTTYQLLAADLGKSVSVTVTATMLGYNTVTKTSASTDAVDIGAFSPAPSPTISGVRAVGSTLTANLGTWGPVAPSFTYRWKRDGTPIGSADGVSYVLTPDDLGHTITVTVRATAPAFAVANQTSDPTAEIALGDFVAGTPSISGTMGAGSTLTALTGTWSPNDIGTTFSYQWLKNGQPILHATDSTYVPPVADVTTYYSVRVTASRDGFTTLAVVSASRLVVKGTMTATVRPTITGTFAYDQVLTGSDGTWSPVLDGATFTYQWFRGKKAIRGATSSTYRITGSDLGAKLSFQVTVTAIGYNNGVAKSVAAVIP